MSSFFRDHTLTFPPPTPRHIEVPEWQEEKMTFKQYFNWFGGFCFATTVLVFLIKTATAIGSWIMNFETDYPVHFLAALGLLFSFYNPGTVLWIVRGVARFLEYLPAIIDESLVSAEIQGWISPRANVPVDIPDTRNNAQNYRTTRQRRQEVPYDQSPISTNQSGSRCGSESSEEASPRKVEDKIVSNLSKVSKSSKRDSASTIDSGSSISQPPFETNQTTNASREVEYPTLPTFVLRKISRKSPVLALSPSLYVLAQYITDLHSQCLGLWVIFLHPQGRREAGEHIDFLWLPRKMMLQMDAIISRLQRISYSVGGRGLSVFAEHPKIEAEIVEVLGLLELLQREAQSQDLPLLIARAREIVEMLASIRQISAEAYGEHPDYKHDHILSLLPSVENHIEQEVREVSEEVKEINEPVIPTITVVDLDPTVEPDYSPAYQTDFDAPNKQTPTEMDQALDQPVKQVAVNTTAPERSSANEPDFNSTKYQDPMEMDETLDRPIEQMIIDTVVPQKEHTNELNFATSYERDSNEMDVQPDQPTEQTTGRATVPDMATSAGKISGTEALIEVFVAHVRAGRMPTSTSFRGYLSGPRALFRSLKSMSAISGNTKSVYEVMGAMFTDFNKLAATKFANQCQKGQKGTPTAEYLAFLRKGIRPEFEGGVTFDEEKFNARIASLTLLNDFSEEGDARFHG